jgi:beta-lactamase regulating signal transducer with metallopeptidase domain
MAWDTFVVEWLVRAAASGFVILTVAAIAVLLCRQPADRVRLIGLALVGAVLTPWLALVPGMPHWRFAVLPPEPVEVTAASQPDLVTGTTESPASFRPQPTIAGPRAESSITESSPQPGADTRLVSTESKPQPVPSAPAESVPAALSGELESPAPAVTVTQLGTRAVLLGYALFTVVFLGWVILGLWRVYLLWRSARPAPTEAVALLREIAGPAADGVRLLVSPRLDTPVAFGGWRPVIVVPELALTPEGRETLRYGLAHEWSHVERGDVWRWYLVTFTQLLLFYQPLFWWLRRQLRLGQDYLADARAADQTDDPVEYAQYLVTLARRRLGAPGLVLGITDRRSNLTRRVHMLLLNRTPLSRRCRFAWTCGAVLLAVGLMTGASAVRLVGASPAPTEDKKGQDEKKKGDEKKAADVPAKGETLNYGGQVTDKVTGKPIAGATVIVRRSVLGDPERKETNPVLEETKHTTDAQGKYSFTIPPEQTALRYLYIELDVEHPDYAPQKGFGYALSMIRKNEKLGGRPFFENVDLRPAKPVTGVVKTPEGKPAAGVKVMAYSVTSKRDQGTFEYGSFADTRTDAEGKFRLPLVTPGWAVVWLLPEQFVPTTHVVKDKRGDLGTFTLQTGPRLKGTVLDAKGKPVAGVTVNAESRDRNEEITEPVADNINRSAVTNDKGEFEMNPLPPGNYLVKPGEYPRDGSLDRKRVKEQPVPGVFIGTKVVLKAGAEPERLEVRAVPHVTIEAQYVDSKGKHTRGHECFVFGQIDGVPWFGQGKADADGKIVAHIPHGLENVQLDLMTNEHGVLRWRKTKDGPLNNNRRVMLGTVTDDVKGIEIVRYTAPILIVKVSVKDGSKPADLAVTAQYEKGKGQFEGGLILKGGRSSDVSFEHQEDGRFRSEQLFPDQEVTVTAHAEGYVGTSEKVKLAEDTTKEIELVLEKAPAKKDDKKDEKKNP